MHRFYLPSVPPASETLTLTGEEAHHALRVLRLRRGEEVVCLDGAGTVWVCAVEECQRQSVGLKVLSRREVPRPPWTVTLIQALPKGKLIEAIVQKATELGVARIVPLLSERVVSRFEGDEGDAKRVKWRGIAVEAIKQCGSAWLPQIDAPICPEDFLARRERFELSLVGYLPEGSRHPREFFRSFRQSHGRNPVSVVVWVGPEGDFSPSELQAIVSSGALPITLGPLVLRSETAAIYCLSILNYELASPAEPATPL
jgi:16S rRNA (uracil1498-N3)-methyltransferase